MNKLIKIVMIMCMFFCMFACSTVGTKTPLLSNELKANDLDIDDFVWESKKTHINGEKLYAFFITNNSDYDILAAEINYKVKEDIDESELSVYDGFMKEHEDYFDEDETKSEITLIGSNESLIKKGEKSKSIPLFIGMGNSCWYDLVSNEQFELMEAEELQLAIIGKDHVLYLAYYDFEEDDWSLDEFSKDLSLWPNNALAEKIIKPESEYLVLTSDVEDEDSIYFTVYDATKDMFDQYVTLIKDKGFINEVYENESYYSGDDEEGNDILISFNKEKGIMDVTLYGV